MKNQRITHICTTCGTESGLNRRRRGNGFLELVLWLALIVPGIMYTSWRNMEDVTFCGVCGHQTLIPIATPMGRRLHDELEPYRQTGVRIDTWRFTSGA